MTAERPVRSGTTITPSKAQGTFWKENQTNPKETEEVGGRWRTEFWE